MPFIFSRFYLLLAVKHSIAIGYSDGAYIYARMLARGAGRITGNRWWQ